MLRHRIVVQASLPDLAAHFAETDFVTLDTHELLKIVRIPEGIGAVREVEDGCMIDLFDDDEGVEVARMVQALRDAGFTVEHTTI